MKKAHSISFGRGPRGIELHRFHFREALLQEYAEFLNVATTVCDRGRSAGLIDLSFSLNAFGHLIRWKFQESFSTGWQLTALDHAEEVGTRFDLTTSEREGFERLFTASCVLDCPICDAIDDAVCELDSDALESGQLVPRRFACTNCGFVVHEAEGLLSEVLLQRQLAESREAILADYGIS